VSLSYDAVSNLSIYLYCYKNICFRRFAFVAIFVTVSLSRMILGTLTGQGISRLADRQEFPQPKDKILNIKTLNLLKQQPARLRKSGRAGQGKAIGGSAV
jgi:hypothetical protein